MAEQHEIILYSDNRFEHSDTCWCKKQFLSESLAPVGNP